MNGWALAGTLLATLLGGGLIGIILQHLREHPRAMAAARKENAEADRLVAETDDIKTASLEGQVNRLDARVKILETQVQDCHQDRDLALAAARFLWDRLHSVAPSDEAVERLRDYLIKPPGLTIPRAMQDGLDRIK
jgi:cell division protein FtsB